MGSRSATPEHHAGAEALVTTGGRAEGVT